MAIVLLLTQDVIEVIAFFVLLSMLILIIRRIEYYLLERRFKQQCEELFTEDFYERLNTTIKNEFK